MVIVFHLFTFYTSQKALKRKKNLQNNYGPCDKHFLNNASC